MVSIKSKTKLQIVNRGENSITIDVNDLFCDSVAGIVCEQLDEFQEWFVVYWGKKKQFKILNLAPASLYEFRIKLVTDESEWFRFKAATTTLNQFTALDLFNAIETSKIPTIRKIIQHKRQLLDTTNKQMLTPLFQAIESGNIVVLELLIRLGANLKTCLLYNYRTPLMCAIYLGHLKIAQLLIDKGAEINVTDVNGMNILHFAVDSGDIDNVQFALDQNIDINSQDNIGLTPLLRAVIAGNQDMVNFLLEKSANPLIKDKNDFDFTKHKEMMSNDTKPNNEFKDFLERLYEIKDPINFDEIDREDREMFECETTLSKISNLTSCIIKLDL